jgi:hypothetical protein
MIACSAVLSGVLIFFGFLLVLVTKGSRPEKEPLSSEADLEANNGVSKGSSTSLKNKKATSPKKKKWWVGFLALPFVLLFEFIVGILEVLWVIVSALAIWTWRKLVSIGRGIRLFVLFIYGRLCIKIEFR